MPCLLRIVDPAVGPFASDGAGYWGEMDDGNTTEIDDFNVTGVKVDSFLSPSFNSGTIDSNGKLLIVSSGADDYVGNCGPGATLAQYGTELGGVRPGPSQAMNWLCQVPYVSADALGDVYAGEYAENPLYSTGQIVEYGPPDATGKRTGIRTISQTVNGAGGSYSVLGPFAGDAHGNLFVVDDEHACVDGATRVSHGDHDPSAAPPGLFHCGAGDRSKRKYLRGGHLGLGLRDWRNLLRGQQRPDPFDRRPLDGIGTAGSYLPRRLDPEVPSGNKPLLNY